MDWSWFAIVTASHTPPAARPREYTGCSAAAAAFSRVRSSGCFMQRSKSRWVSDQDASASSSSRSSCSTSDRKSTSRGNCTADSAATRQLGSFASGNAVAALPIPEDGTTYSTYRVARPATGRRATTSSTGPNGALSRTPPSTSQAPASPVVGCVRGGLAASLGVSSTGPNAAGNDADARAARASRLVSFSPFLSATEYVRVLPSYVAAFSLVKAYRYR